MLVTMHTKRLILDTYTSRFFHGVRQIGALLIFASISICTARADLFDITLTSGGTQAGSGQFATDGTCSVCGEGFGLTAFSATVNGFTFDLDDSLAISYDRAGNLLSGSIVDPVEPAVLLFASPNFALAFPSGPLVAGTVSISPASVPEPSSIALLASAVAGVGFSLRRKIKRPS
jgi:hypothetical protein